MINQLKDKLLSELDELVDIKTGRKRRSDKGHIRGLYGRRDCQDSALTIYHRVLTRLQKRDAELQKEGEVSLFRGFDENGFWIVIPAAYSTKSSNYKQDYKGRAIQHTVKRVCIQKEVDLEEYRFNAWYELATNPEFASELVLQSPDLNALLLARYGLNPKQITTALSHRHLDWYTLFQETYYVEHPEQWTYELWKSHYDCCPKILLDEDFRFNINAKPGTPDFMPEWQYHKDKIEKQHEIDCEQEKLRRASQFISNLRRAK